MRSLQAACLVRISHQHDEQQMVPWQVLQCPTALQVCRSIPSELKRTRKHQSALHSATHITADSAATGMMSARWCHGKYFKAQAHSRCAGAYPVIDDAMRDRTKDSVALASHTRADSTPFWLTFPPLQAVPSFACSVASLSRFPGH